MFQSNVPGPSTGPKNENSGSYQDEEYKVENVQVFSMKTDLENIDNPNSRHADSPHPTPTENPSPRKSLENLSIKEKQSPFLSQVESQNIKPEKPQKKTNWQVLIMLSIVIFLLLTTGVAVYYYWITKGNDSYMTSPDSISLPKEEPLIFSIEKPNYLPVDIDNPDKSKIKEKIGVYAKKVLESGSLMPVEFIVTDLKNNPVGFESFTSIFGINLSPDIMESLKSENSFSLFIYNSNNGSRLGLAIDSKDDYKLKTSIFQKETDLPEMLKPLFPDNITFSIDKKTFGSGSYAGTEIRYINLTSPDDLTVDYAIYNNKLIIGTTKATIQAVMDYINNHSDVESVENTTDNTTIGE